MSFHDKHPSSISLEPAQLILGFPDGKQRTFTWDQLRSVSIYPSKNISLTGKETPGYGVITFWSEMDRYQLSVDNADMVKRYFLDRFGSDPRYLCGFYDEEFRNSRFVRDAFPPYASRSIETREYTNPVSNGHFYLWCLVAVLSALIFGVVPLMAGYIYGVVFLFASPLILLAAVYSGYFHRPVSVTVRRDGFDLKFQSGKCKSFAWKDVNAVLWNPYDKTFKSMKQAGNCGIRVRGDSPFNVVDEIGVKFLEAFVAATGQIPFDDTREHY